MYIYISKQINWYNNLLLEWFNNEGVLSDFVVSSLNEVKSANPSLHYLNSYYDQLYKYYTVSAKIFRRKDITLTRNRIIRICIQNTPVPTIAGYF